MTNIIASDTYCAGTESSFRKNQRNEITPTSSQLHIGPKRKRMTTFLHEAEEKYNKRKRKAKYSDPCAKFNPLISPTIQPNMSFNPLLLFSCYSLFLFWCNIAVVVSKEGKSCSPAQQHTQPGRDKQQYPIKEANHYYGLQFIEGWSRQSWSDAENVH